MNRVVTFPKPIDELFMIPIGGNSKSFIDVGDRIGFGQKLFETRRRLIVDSYYLPKILGNKIEDSADYVGRISGEFVSKGDLLAEKLTAGGMVGKRVISGVEGVINLDRISLGYIDIHGEEEKVDLFSNIEGVVEEFSLNSHILVRATAASFKIVDSYNINSGVVPRSEIFSGELVTIEDGSSVYTPNVLKDSYEGKIVYAGRFLYPDTAKEIYKRGALALITYSLDYETLEMLNFPVVVVGGYGLSNGSYDLAYLLSSNVGHVIRIDTERKQISVANGDMVDLNILRKGYRFKEGISEGDYVNTISSEHFGLIGRVIEVYKGDDHNSCLVETASNARVVINEENLELYISAV